MKFDGQTIIKAVVMGAGALIVPALLKSITSVATILGQIPGWGMELYSGITVGGLIGASAGVLLVDQLLYK